MTQKHLNYLLLAALSVPLCLIALYFMGCATVSCPQPESVTGKKHILRTVLVVDRFIDEGGSLELDENAQVYTRDGTGFGNKFILKCGSLWAKQTGIELEIVETIVIPRWKWADPYESMDEFKAIISHIDPKTYDIAIGIGMSLGSVGQGVAAAFFMVPVWAGFIEDKYRRYIRLKDAEDVWMCQHELAHCFDFSLDHTGGLLGPIAVMSTNSPCLLPKDLANILSNKFRDFNKPVVYK